MCFSLFRIVVLTLSQRKGEKKKDLFFFNLVYAEKITDFEMTFDAVCVCGMVWSGSSP